MCHRHLAAEDPGATQYAPLKSLDFYMSHPLTQKNKIRSTMHYRNIIIEELRCKARARLDLIITAQGLHTAPSSA
jgi:hypothetical protein